MHLKYVPGSKMRENYVIDGAKIHKKENCSFGKNRQIWAWKTFRLSTYRK